MKITSDLNTYEWLSSFTSPTTRYLYVLLDPLKSVFIGEQLHLDELKKRFAQQIEIVLRPDLAYSPQHCPHLLVLAKPHEQPNLSLLSATIAYAQKERFYPKRYICGWISSELSPHQMAKQLVTNMERIIQQSGSTALPYFEPFRLALLLNTLENEEVRSLFSFITHWSFLNTQNHITMLDNEGSAIKAESVLPIRFNHLTEQVQAHRQALLQLYEMWEDVSEESLPPDALTRVISVWLALIKLPLHHQSDRFFLALNRLTLTDQFCELPEVVALIQRASQSDSFNLPLAITQLSSRVWKTVEPT